MSQEMEREMLAALGVGNSGDEQEDSPIYPSLMEAFSHSNSTFSMRESIAERQSHFYDALEKELHQTHAEIDADNGISLLSTKKKATYYLVFFSDVRIKTFNFFLDSIIKHNTYVCIENCYEKKKNDERCHLRNR